MGTMVIQILAIIVLARSVSSDMEGVGFGNGELTATVHSAAKKTEVFLRSVEANSAINTHTSEVAFQVNDDKNSSSDTHHEFGWKAFEYTGAVNYKESMDVVRKLPLTNYWDVTKGSFRLGILGDDAMNSLPEFVSHVDKNVGQAGNKNYHTVKNVPVVEPHAILFHAISALNHLSGKSVDLDLHPLRQEIIRKRQIDATRVELVGVKYATILSSTIGRTRVPQGRSDEEKSKPRMSRDLKLVRQALELRLEALNSKIEREKLQTKHRVEIENYRSEVRFRNHWDHHTLLLNSTGVHQHNLNKIAALKPQTQLSISADETKQHLAAHRTLLEREMEIEKEIIYVQINSSVGLIKFRFAEEIRIERELEPVAIRISKARDDLSRESIDAGVQSITAELINQFSSVFQDSESFTAWAQRLLVSFFLLILLYEIISSAPSLLYTKLFKKSLREKMKRNTSTVSEAGHLSSLSCLNKLVLAKQAREKFENYTQTLRNSRNHGGFLPNLLLTGEHGTGKSLGAECVAQESRISIITICESDLETFGSNAGLHLREFFEGCERQGGATAVIIDGADLLVRSRDSTSPELRYTFYTLLEAIKVSSRKLCVILSTSLSPFDIDAAVLDRMDFHIHLSLPDMGLRLKFVIRKCQEYLLRFMDVDSQSYCSRILAADEEQSNEYSNLLVEIANSCVAATVSSSSGPPLSSRSTTRVSSDYSTSPETDLPSDSGEEQHCIQQHQQQERPSIVHSLNFDRTSNVCDLPRCLQVLVVASDRWSYRELEKFVLAIRSEVLSNEVCKLTTAIWMTELKGRLKC